MRSVLALGALVLTEFLVSAVAFCAFDHVNFLLALYWATETATTVGYGDVTPHTAGAHWVSVATMLTVIPTVGALFGRASAIHTIRVWHHRHPGMTEGAAQAAASAQAAHQIAADLYREQTGNDHPQAPSPPEEQ